MPWYIFAAITPTFYSFSNFIEKYLIEKRIKDPLAISAISGIVYGIIGISIGLVIGFKNIGIMQTALIIFAGILLVFYLLPYFEAMKIEDTSRVVPLFQFIPVFTLILSSFVLKEFLTPRQIFGLLIVVCAGLLISVNKFDGRIFHLRKSLWFMLAASFMYSCIGVLFRFTVKETSFLTTLSYEYIGTGIGSLMLLSIPKVRNALASQFKGIKNSTGIISVNSAFSILAQVSESYAVSLVAVPFVHIIGSTQPVISLLEGLILTKFFPHIIKEDIRKNVLVQKSVSIVLIIIGLYLVYF